MFRILVTLIAVLVVYIIGSGCAESFAKNDGELEIDSVDNSVVMANTQFGFNLFNEIRKVDLSIN